MTEELENVIVELEEKHTFDAGRPGLVTYLHLRIPLPGGAAVYTLPISGDVYKNIQLARKLQGGK